MDGSVEGLRERIEGAKSLQSIVETMRTLALVNIRRAEQAAESSAEYLRTVHLGLHVASRGRFGLQTDRSAGILPTLLVLSSNQGLCGQFNERAAARALEIARRVVEANREYVRRRETAPADQDTDQGTYHDTDHDADHDADQDAARLDTGVESATARAAKTGEGTRRGGRLGLESVPMVCVGYRGADRLDAGGANVVDVLDAPTSVEAIAPLVREIYRVLDERREQGAMRRLIVVHNRPAGGTSFTERSFQLLPFDPSRWKDIPEGETPFRTVPQTSAPPQEIIEDLARELLFIDIFQSLTDSFAAENAARLASMQGASDNIEELLTDLESQYREARQDAITNELMDIFAGSAATESW